MRAGYIPDKICVSVCEPVPEDNIHNNIIIIIINTTWGKNQKSLTSTGVLRLYRYMYNEFSSTTAPTMVKKYK